MSSFRTRLTAVGMALLGAVALAGPADASIRSAASASATSDRAHADFSAQARAAGLDDGRAAELQRQIDTELATTGGRQVAANKIDLDGKGVLILPLPGEKRARDLNAQGATGAFAEPCARGWVCLYPQPNYEGKMWGLYDCYKVATGYTGTGSWYNNQPSNYHVKFYGHDGNLGWTSPGGPVGDPNAPWDWVGYVKPC
ncbi:peptidase inhibitor family I36 protein [Streptomyces sp. NPDC060028]|uniref:peptidase inhibitor family I36 protein n=1 Tax=Streptomyces sp. NPDC060028 TaxID=3347041 RepID=UPI0036C4FA73